MKWVKFDADFEKSGSLYRLSEANPDETYYRRPEKKKVKESCFEIYKSSKKLEEQILKGEQVLLNIDDHLYHKWVCHNDLPEAYFKPQYFDEAYYKKLGEGHNLESHAGNDRTTPHPYEIFIGGWLDFHDSVVMCGDSDYGVFFIWDYTCRCVTVYISQLKPSKRWNVNININPPASSDPPPPKNPPPYC
jgi:hypothetical protein